MVGAESDDFEFWRRVRPQAEFGRGCMRCVEVVSSKGIKCLYCVVLAQNVFLILTFQK